MRHYEFANKVINGTEKWVNGLSYLQQLQNGIFMPSCDNYQKNTYHNVNGYDYRSRREKFMKIRIQNINIKTILEVDGWFNGRDISIDIIKSTFINRGIHLNKPAEEILTSFGGLTINIQPDYFIDMRFDVFETVQNSEFFSNFKKNRVEIVKYFINMDDISPIGIISLDKDGIDTDEIYISGNANPILYSYSGICIFRDLDDFLEKLYLRIPGTVVATSDSINKYFPDGPDDVILPDKFLNDLIRKMNS